MHEIGVSRPAEIFWLCGLSGAGKSTVANAVLERLSAEGMKVLSLDGDVIREHLHENLGFTREDVLTNNAGIAELCASKSDSHDVILVPVISPLKEGRDAARQRLGDQYHLVWCAADIDTVRDRDVKGLYAGADRGEITDLIGYSPDGLAFEEPVNPDLVLETGSRPTEECTQKLLEFIRGSFA